MRLIAIALVVAAAAACGETPAPAVTAEAAVQDDEPGVWVELDTRRWPGGVWDGDTIMVGDEERIRLLCIDTPERGEPWRDEGAERLRELLASGNAYLRSDSTRTTDRWGRTLAYVWAEGGDDGLIDVADVLLSEGLARVYTDYPCDFTAHYQRVEAEAREAGLGMWAPEQ